MGRVQPLSPTRCCAGATSTKTFFILLKSFIGSAVLFLPSAVASGGVAFSVVLMAVMCLWNLDTMMLLFNCSVETESRSFGELAEGAYGRSMRLLVEGSLCLAQFGFCTAYFIFVSQSIRP